MMCRSGSNIRQLIVMLLSELCFWQLQEYCLVRPHTAQTGASGPQPESTDVTAEPCMVSNSPKIAEADTM